MSKLSMALSGSFVIGSGSFNGRRKTTQIMTNTINRYRCPLRFRFARNTEVMYTLKAAFAVFVAGSIPLVLRVIAVSQIFASIIKSVSITVIDFNIAVSFNDHTVHRNGCGLLQMLCSACVKRLRATVPISAPIPLRQPLEILNINDGVLALRERNQANRLILRLGYFVSDNTTFSHRSTSNGSLLPAALYYKFNAQGESPSGLNLDALTADLKAIAA